MQGMRADNQYRGDILAKIGLTFERGRKLLDVGCGDGHDAEIFIDRFGLDTYGIDVYQHQDVESVKGLKFKKGGIFNIPFDDQSFDYIFLHDVLHHIDEPQQRYEKHIAALKKLKRVCKQGGYILIVEANRYNPLSYPHMVLFSRHRHFTRPYFEQLVGSVFDRVEFKHFEAHLYPPRFLRPFRIYERIMEGTLILRPFLAYNVSVIRG